MNNSFVWGIFLAVDSKEFPNFFPIGIYTTRDLAIKQIEVMPKDYNYQLLKMPIDKDFSYFNEKTGKLIGMDSIFHEHFHFKEEDHLR